jgi:hypothetical protein
VLTGKASEIEVVALSGAADDGVRAAAPDARYCLIVYLCRRYSLRVSVGVAAPG